MAQYLLIESRDPFESKDVEYLYELARGLVADGSEVTLFLVQNGVLAARATADVPALRALAREGVRVVADDYSLRARGITRLAERVTASPIDLVVDHLAAGHKVLWH